MVSMKRFSQLLLLFMGILQGLQEVHRRDPEVYFRQPQELFKLTTFELFKNII